MKMRITTLCDLRNVDIGVGKYLFIVTTLSLNFRNVETLLSELHCTLPTFFLQNVILVYLLCSRFGTWPVAMLAQSKNKAILEGPVCNGSQVIGWHTNEKSKRLRRFHVDMSGFAFNSTILWDPKRWKRPTSVPIRQLDSVKEGFQVFIVPLLLLDIFCIIMLK